MFEHTLLPGRFCFSLLAFLTVAGNVFGAEFTLSRVGDVRLPYNCDITYCSPYLDLTPFHDHLYFSGSSPDLLDAGGFLRTDGVVVEWIADISPESRWGAVEYDGMLYFQGSPYPLHSEMYKSDGSSVVLAFPDESIWSSYGFTEFAGDLYFGAQKEPGGSSRIFRTDGSVVEELGEGQFRNPIVHAGNIYFWQHPTPRSVELLRTDGTAITAVDSFTTEGTSLGFNGSYKDALYFSTRNGIGGDTAFYKTDGNVVSKVADSSAGYATEFDGQFYFSMNGSLSRTDGVTVTSVFDINPRSLTTYNGDLYFLGQAGHLYRTDGIRLEEVPVIDPLLAGYSGESLSIVDFTGELFFFATVPSDNPYEPDYYLLRSNGRQVEEAVEVLWDTSEGPFYHDSKFIEFNGCLYLPAAIGDGYGLFRVSVVPEPSTVVGCIVCWLLLFVSSSRTNYTLMK
jgi:hypothetical protein